jgi:signal peptidase
MKLVNILGTILVILLVAIAVFVFLSPRLGWRIDTVLSGSMEPHLQVGGVVVTQPADIASISKGDIITFRSPLNGKLTSHRVTDIVDAESRGFRVKGDANEDADPFTITAEQLVGRVFLHIPYFGYVTSFLKTSLGLILTMCLPALIIVIMEIRNICRAASRRRYERKYYY